LKRTGRQRAGGDDESIVQKIFEVKDARLRRAGKIPRAEITVDRGRDS
jgi:hypothetical protein